jgi:hypothetical protein
VAVSTKTSKAGKPYQSAEVAYKNLDSGKVEAKNITQYSEVFKTVADVQAGQTLDVKQAKNDNGFWEWTSVERLVGNQVSAATEPSRSASANPAPRSNYETPEERASRQVYIVKQSSISSAIALLSVGAKSPPQVDAVLDTAQKFTDFVFGKTDLFKQANDLPAYPNADPLDDVPV